MNFCEIVGPRVVIEPYLLRITYLISLLHLPMSTLSSTKWIGVAKNRVSKIQQPLLRTINKLTKKLENQQRTNKELMHKISSLEAQIKFLECRLKCREERKVKEEILESEMIEKEEEQKLLAELDAYLNS